MDVPRMYRVMREDADGRPKVAHWYGLGVRTPEEPGPDGQVDTTPDPDGKVHPEGGGMSVFSETRFILQSLLPGTLRSKGFPGARGPEDARVYRMGTGPFREAPVAERLMLRPGRKRRHGAVEPVAPMPLAEYQAALAATRDGWAIVEVGELP